MIQAPILADETAATPHDVALLELAAENADLRLQLAEVQEQCIEMAIDAGALQAEIEELRAQVALLRAKT
jgi:hypothetical protein